MKKILKPSLIIIIGIFVSVVLYLNYHTYLSKSAKEGELNINNIKKIKKGMSVEEVLLIMGKPDTKTPPDKNRYPYIQYNYNTNDESSPNVTIVLDSTNTVIETYNYKDK